MYHKCTVSKMTTMLLLSIVGLLLVTAYTETKSVCPRNTTSTQCAPCNQFCNQEARSCALYCVLGQNFCQCAPGYFINDKTSKRCVLEKDCPPATNSTTCSS